MVALCDVDENKIAAGVYQPCGPEFWGEGADKAARAPPRALPVVHFSAAVPPLLLAVKGDLTGGAFEANLASLKLAEGVDYVAFS